MRRDEPIYISKYACDYELLYQTVRKHLRRYVKNSQNMILLPKSVNDKYIHNTVKIKFGMEIPHDYK